MRIKLILSLLIVVLHCTCEIIWLRLYNHSTPMNEYVFLAYKRGFDSLFIFLALLLSCIMNDNDYKGFILMEGVFILVRGLMYIIHYSGIYTIGTSSRIEIISAVMIAYLVPTSIQIWNRLR